MMLAVSVVICTYSSERLEQLFDALASLTRQTLHPENVVVVVDGNDALATHLSQALPECEVIGLAKRMGLATARNAGVAACNSDIVMFLDDDAVAEPTWVEQLANTIAIPGVLGASGFSAPIWPGQPPAWLPAEFLWAVGASYRGQPTTRTQVRNVYGGCCGLRRSLFLELDGYDRRLGRGPFSQGGGEEAELCLRALQRWPEGAFFYEPDARIHHHVTSDRIRIRYLLRRAYAEGRMKSAVARLQPGALAPEMAFSKQLPVSLCRYLIRGVRGDRDALKSTGVVLAMSAAVVLGLMAGSVQSLSSPNWAGQIEPETHAPPTRSQPATNG